MTESNQVVCVSIDVDLSSKPPLDSGQEGGVYYDLYYIPLVSTVFFIMRCVGEAPPPHLHYCASC